MVEQHKDPSLNELLDRIVRLECQLSVLQSQIGNRFNAEVSPLKARIDDLGEAFKFQVDASGAEILHIHELVWPLVHKVFPGFSGDQKQLNAIVPPSAVDRQADHTRRDGSSD